VPDTLQVNTEPFTPKTFTEHCNVLRGYLGMELAKSRITGNQSATISKLLTNVEAAHHLEVSEAVNGESGS
jgi:hypothetical protein